LRYEAKSGLASRFEKTKPTAGTRCDLKPMRNLRYEAKPGLASQFEKTKPMAGMLCDSKPMRNLRYEAKPGLEGSLEKKTNGGMTAPPLGTTWGRVRSSLHSRRLYFRF